MKTILLLAVSALIGAVIAGSVVYVWQQSEMKDLKAERNSFQVELEKALKAYQ